MAKAQPAGSLITSRSMHAEVCHLAASAAKYFAEHDFHVMEPGGGFEQWQRHGLSVVK